jgi:tetratricopeptide (TPR) repeat protein
MRKECINKYKQLVKTSTKHILRYLMELTIEQALQQGVAAHKEGKLQDAERLYRAILQSQPLHPDANHNLGLIAVSVNKPDVALPLFKTALEANPKIEQFWLSYIEALIKEKQFENAKAVLEQAKQQRVAEEKLNTLEAQLSFETQIQNVNFESPSQQQRTILLEHYQNGRLSDAEKLATSISHEFPSHNFSWKILGAVFKATGRNSEAVNANQTAVTLSPQDAEAHYNLGNTLKELGRLDEALASYTQAITLKPDFAEARYNLGILWFENKKYNLAAEQFELCDTPQSKLYAIKCSYLQDEETVFYEKFDLLVNQGEVNAVIGSLGFRSEFKYGIKKSNSFCNDPLKYVVKTDLNALYDFENIFIETARAVLTDNSVSYKAQGHLTNGIQTAGNIFAQGKVPKTEIESIIHAEIEKYRIQFKDSEEGFIKSWPTSYEIKGWLVCMQSGGKLAPHMHDTGWITGSIYINVPPKSETDSGNLVLCLSDQEHVLAVEKNQQSTIDVVTGSLCLFPSSLHHYTVPFEEKEDRIVLAFDVIPKDKTIN